VKKVTFRLGFLFFGCPNCVGLPFLIGYPFSSNFFVASVFAALATDFSVEFCASFFSDFLAAFFTYLPVEFWSPFSRDFFASFSSSFLPSHLSILNTNCQTISPPNNWKEPLAILVQWTTLKHMWLQKAATSPRIKQEPIAHLSMVNNYSTLL
jgi:hypothetical protein